MTAHYLAVLVVVVYLAYLLKRHLELIHSKEYCIFQGVDMTDFPRAASNPDQIRWVRDEALYKLGQDYPMSRCLKIIGTYEKRFPKKS